MRNNIVEITDLDTPTLSRLSSGFSVPLLAKMHYGSAGRDGGALNWDSYPLSDTSSNEQLEKFVHYEEALPCLDSCTFEGKSILVIGSSVPWLECYLARRGASSITTVEYREVSWHPNFRHTTWKAITFDTFLRTSPIAHDLLVSYSSIEHSGLGRYGDAISPDGDMETLFVARRWMHTRSTALIAVPIGPDLIFFNRHRVYGPQRLKRLASVLHSSITQVVKPAYSFGVLSPMDDVWTLDYAFRQPSGYDRQLLVEFEAC